MCRCILIFRTLRGVLSVPMILFFSGVAFLDSGGCSAASSGTAATAAETADKSRFLPGTDNSWLIAHQEKNQTQESSVIWMMTVKFFFKGGVVCLFFNLCRSEAGTKKCKRTSICERAVLCRWQSMKCVQSPLFTCLNAFYWMICCESRHRSYSSYLFHYPLSLICKSECVTVCVTAAELTSISWYALGKTDSTSEHWICCHITAGWKVICKSLNAVVLEKRKRNLKRKKFIYKKKVCCQQVFMSVAGMNSKKEICLWSVPRWK